ncbi:MAG: DUF389 domain-containing protein [Patescibacteria group bacterium]|nr:DUF389 domain-containing protein [Patescibacteria group bacterium]
MFNGIFTNVTESDKNTAIEGIIQHATPRHDFFVMLTLSVAMASFGLLLNNITIVVGSMLIAPLLYPLLSLSLGIITADIDLISRSIFTIFKSMVFAIATGFAIGLLFSSHHIIFNPPFVNTINMQSPLMYALVAAIAGFAAAFAIIKPRLSDTLPGVAISVALVPPLSVAGLAISSFNWAVFSNAFLLFLVNVVGIVFSAMIVFALFRFSIKKVVTQEIVKHEDKIVKKEENKISKV